MIKRTPIALIALLASAALTASPAGAIVNGAPASRADYPFFAELAKGCGGSLIRPDRVLTAAHCIEVLEEAEYVRVGPKKLRRNVVKHAIHPLNVREQAKMQREFPPPAADLMLLQLDRPVKGISPLPIATAAEELTAPGQSVTVIGRGATASDGSGEGVFRSGTVALQPLSVCREQIDSPRLRTWSLCTRDPRMADPNYPGPFTSNCFGDSGGPLLAGPPGAFRLIGTDSWGPKCGEERDPEVFANAVVGRKFALAAKPIWAPQALGPPRVTGTPRVGHLLTCAVRWLVRPTKELSYEFSVNGKQAAPGGPRPTYRVRPGDVGKRISCSANGSTAGGRGGPRSLAPPRLVRP